MEPNENQHEGGKQGERLAKRRKQRRGCLLYDTEKLYSETRKIINERCSQTVDLFIQTKGWGNRLLEIVNEQS